MAVTRKGRMSRQMDLAIGTEYPIPSVNRVSFMSVSLE